MGRILDFSHPSRVFSCFAKIFDENLLIWFIQEIISLFCLNITIKFCGFDILIFCRSSRPHNYVNDIVIAGCYHNK